MRRVGLGADILDVVAGVVRSGHRCRHLGGTSNRLIIAPPLSRGLARCCSVSVGSGLIGGVCDFAANVGLGLGLRRVINHDDLLGETIAIKLFPVGFPRAATLPRAILLLRLLLCRCLRGHGCVLFRVLVTPFLVRRCDLLVVLLLGYVSIRG